MSCWPCGTVSRTNGKSEWGRAAKGQRGEWELRGWRPESLFRLDNYSLGDRRVTGQGVALPRMLCARPSRDLSRHCCVPAPRTAPGTDGRWEGWVDGRMDG